MGAIEIKHYKEGTETSEASLVIAGVNIYLVWTLLPDGGKCMSIQVVNARHVGSTPSGIMQSWIISKADMDQLDAGVAKIYRSCADDAT